VQFVYVVLKVLYNLFLHPLRSYPGPLFARASLLAHQRQAIKGNSHLWLQELHRIYGPVVRSAPNTLSFIQPEVWKDAYGYKATSFMRDVKHFYGEDVYGDPPGMVRADNISHARQRKLVSHAFSDQALKEQEPILKGYAEVLVQKLKEIAVGKDDTKLDLVKWYNFTTFDIMVSTSIYKMCVTEILTFLCQPIGQFDLR
jgi:hypothetical protein